VTGIALAGWDRTGWQGGWGDRWMRLRDRRALLAALVTASGYAALLLWGADLVAHALAGRRPLVLPPGIALLLRINLALLLWRLAMRAWWTGRVHGPGEALRAVPRALVGNVVALAAAARAVGIYARLLRGGPVRWDKTAHHYAAAAE
jgi:adsorption protein B